MDRPIWDPEKDRINRAKHGVTFEEARLVLLDPLTRRWPDLDHSGDEDRTIAIGTTLPGQLLVVVTSVEDGKMRIISARRATKRERHAYEDF